MKIDKGITLEQLSTGLERGIQSLDELRFMRLSDALRLQGAQNQVQAREYERLGRKYGKDHPRTLNAAAKIELGKEHIQAMSIVHTTVSAPRPDPGKGWAVDGFVRTSSGDPVAGVTVAAYDRQDQWYEEFGYDCTDNQGYFSIVVETLPEKSPSPVFMHASKDKKLIPSNEVKLSPEPQSSDRVDIIIEDIPGKGDCAPPAGGKGAPRMPEARGKEKPDQPRKDDEEMKATKAGKDSEDVAAKRADKPLAEDRSSEKVDASGNAAPARAPRKQPPKQKNK